MSWTNLCEILTISNELERDFYIAEASKEKWSKRTLRRQIESGLFLKLADFLLELGKGFTFVGRQYPIHIGNDFYHADLVFYHRILKCFVIIDLKINKVKHEDIRTNEYVYGIFCHRRKRNR